jgi:hypothetical protein
MDLIVAEKLAIALGLGLLVGLQREWTAPHVVGIRVFALITVLGTVLALFAETTGGWLPVAGLIAVAGTLVVGGVLQRSANESEADLTAQVAALLKYAVAIAVRKAAVYCRSFCGPERATRARNARGRPFEIARPEESEEVIHDAADR